MADSGRATARPSPRPLAARLTKRIDAGGADSPLDALSTLQAVAGNQAVQRLARSGALPDGLIQARRDRLGNQAIQRLATAARRR